MIGSRREGDLHGFIEEVAVRWAARTGPAAVGDLTLTAVITADAVEALKLPRGDDGVAVVKSTEGVIGRSAAPGESQPRVRQRKIHSDDQSRPEVWRRRLATPDTAG